MSPGRAKPRLLVLLAVVVALLGLLSGTRRLSPASAGLELQIIPSRLPADGVSAAKLLLRATNGVPLRLSQLRIEIVEGGRRARIESVNLVEKVVHAEVRAGVLPGRVVVEASGEGLAPARFSFETLLDPSDWAQDGTPDFLRIDDPTDEQAFRGWFTSLAEAQFYRPPDKLPPEINDCAGLIRFAYREALRQHDGGWATELGLDALPGLGSVRKY
jgi:hypothetical protein